MNRQIVLKMTAWRTMDLLTERKALLYPQGTAFWVWPRKDRVVLVFDPAQIDLRKVNEVFAHELSTRLQGRRVVRTNTRGLFLQVGYNIPLAPINLKEKPFDLDEQETPWHMPLGHTQRGDVWISLLEGDSFLIGGSRGTGKSGLLHGWVQALLHGRQTHVYAWDGKKGVEFVRYLGRDNFHLLFGNFSESFAALKEEIARRRELLVRSGQPNILLYNGQADTPLLPIALVIDEAALVPDEMRVELVRFVERERDTGFYPILATNKPQQAALLVKSNLVTRICLPVPTWNTSNMVLGENGAEKLPKVRGRGLLEYQARMVEFQAFLVDYPEPTDAALAEYENLLEQTTQEQEAAEGVDEELIREMYADGKSISAIIRELWNITGGGSYYARQEQVRAIVEPKTTTSSTSSSLQEPVFGD